MRMAPWGLGGGEGLVGEVEKGMVDVEAEMRKKDARKSVGKEKGAGPPRQGTCFLVVL
jgi:hypothetical protein